jgi:hypothetical protein
LPLNMLVLSLFFSWFSPFYAPESGFRLIFEKGEKFSLSPPSRPLLVAEPLEYQVFVSQLGVDIKIKHIKRAGDFNRTRRLLHELEFQPVPKVLSCGFQCLHWKNIP